MLPVAAGLAERLQATAQDLDQEGAVPVNEARMLGDAGLFAVPLPRGHGGLGLGTEPGGYGTLLALLSEIGRGSLSLGRLYEGHVNTLQLINTVGTEAQQLRAAADARDGRLLFGVWNTEAADGVTIEPLASGRYRLAGSKTFASGAGVVARAIVPGRLPDGGWQMCLVPMDRVATITDPSWWRPIGMYGSASFKVDFTGVELERDALIGGPGDYHRQPWFSGGAIRFAAVQLGGAMSLFDAARDELRALGRIIDPHQRARFGQMAIAIEGGRLWLHGAAPLLDAALADDRVSGRGSGSDVDAATSRRIVAYANMTRTAIEHVCLDLIQLVERSIGARGLLKPNPIERIIRDLTLYLRQPAPDAALTDVGQYVLESTANTTQLWQAEA